MPYKDPEAARACDQRYKLRNREKLRARRRAYYVANREAILAYKHKHLDPMCQGPVLCEGCSTMLDRAREDPRIFRLLATYWQRAHRW